MFHKRGFRRRHQGVRLRGIDADYGATLAAGGDGHVAADEEGEAAEHLLLGQLRVAAHELPDAPGELLVVGHGDERTDRRPRGREISWRASLPSDALGHVLSCLNRPEPRPGR
jgi:hypothetical protein